MTINLIKSFDAAFKSLENFNQMGNPDLHQQYLGAKAQFLRENQIFGDGSLVNFKFVEKVGKLKGSNNQVIRHLARRVSSSFFDMLNLSNQTNKILKHYRKMTEIVHLCGDKETRATHKQAGRDIKRSFFSAMRSASFAFFNAIKDVSEEFSSNG